jgi:hypothetical protein
MTDPATGDPDADADADADGKVATDGVATVDGLDVRVGDAPRGLVLPDVHAVSASSSGTTSRIDTAAP